jgi:hypothetical protein
VGFGRGQGAFGVDADQLAAYARRHIIGSIEMMICVHAGVSGANLEHGYTLNGIELQPIALAGSVFAAVSP